MKARSCCFPARPVSENRVSRPRSWSFSTGEPHTRLRYFCSPQHTNSALHPIIGQMERAAGLARDDTLQAKLDKLDVLLAAVLDLGGGRRAPRRNAVAAERWALSRARARAAAAPGKNDGRAHQATGNPVQFRSCAHDLRGCALGRPHEPRAVRSACEQDREPSRTADHDLPAGIRGALDRAAARDRRSPSIGWRPAKSTR